MKTLTLLLFCATLSCARAQDPAPPVRLAIVGLVHDHVRGMLPALAGRTDVTLVGIVEPNRALADHYAAAFHLDPALFFPTLDALRAKTPVQVVAAFTSTFDHRRVVEMCAPLGIDVMMEKPFAVSMADARAMDAAARKGGIRVVVNYETTWYPSNTSAFDFVHTAPGVGEIHKIVVRDGHSGPQKICSAAFLDWLTDPVLNGGGALMDFGCYGADLVTWLMDGRRPTSVFAVTQNFQPDVYKKVEDEATIVVTYPHTQAIIQASWNWPYGRKDMDIYGSRGALRLPDRNSVFLRVGEEPETTVPAPSLAAPNADALSYLVAVVRRQIEPAGLSSIGVNLVVTEILDAARESARTGRRVDLPAESGGRP
ncbi:MAG TPA: Gfo/Idh/MocA family oxidoreductase [Opitutaceae bacterium]